MSRTARHHSLHKTVRQCCPARFPHLALAISAVIAVALGSASAPAAAQLPPAAAASAPTAAALDDLDVQAAGRLFGAWLQAHMAERGTPGVMVGVVHDQRLVWQQGFGFADVATRRRMTAQTPFRMASHSKMLTAIAILQLREQGLLRLDDPVDKHLQWFKARPAGDDDGAITIEQLLSHSSGLQREAGDHWTSLQFPTRAELQALFAERQSTFAPQVRWKYSNLAYGIAGLIVERLSGQPLADYVQANIFTPLGMVGSSYDRDVPGLATPYGRRLPDGTRTVFPFVDASGMAAATGLTSTLDDMARYVSAQFRRGPRGGAQVVSSGSLREMHRVRSVDENWTTGTGLGFFTTRINNKSYIGHGGGYPGYTTQTMFHPADKLGVIVLTNSIDSGVGDITRQALAAFGPPVAKLAVASAPTAVAWDPAWARFQGLYRSRNSDATVVMLNKRLVMLGASAPGIDAALKLEPLGNGRFRLDSPTGGPAVGEAVYFVEAAGRPMRMHVGDNWSDRIAAP